MSKYLHKNFITLQYTLETFTEARKTGFMHVPYRGGPVDGPENGPPPPPWAIHCLADSMFHTHVKKMEVPHTATVRVCVFEYHSKKHINCSINNNFIFENYIC